MADDNDDTEGFRGGQANKKYTFFVIDGSESIWFFRELLNVCCLRSLNNHVGVVVTNTKKTTDKAAENSVVLLPIGVPSQDEVNEIKALLDDENIKDAFESISGGFYNSDLAQILNYCKREFASFSNTRHQSVFYFTNDRQPFGSGALEDSNYFKKTLSAVKKIVGRGQRKTLGEFSVVFFGEKPEEGEFQPEKEPLYLLDTEVFDTDITPAKRIRQKTTALRSLANIGVHLGPGVSFDVGVYILAAEAPALPHTKKYLKKTEQPLLKRVGYVPVSGESSAAKTATVGGVQKEIKEEVDEDDFGATFLGRGGFSDWKSKNELKRMLEIGGEKVMMSQKQYDSMGRFGEKGITLLGFRPIDSIDVELCVAAPKFLRPNEESTLGSTRLYRALLDRCHERQQAMICRYQSRSNERLRLVALIPWKNTTPKDGPESTASQRAGADVSDFIHDGFHVFVLPYKEEVRDDVERIRSGGPLDGKWPEVCDTDVHVARAFVKKLTMSYNPSFYENPRLLSQKAALVERATGDVILERKDTLVPYHAYPERMERVKEEVKEFVDYFCLEDALHALEAKPKTPRRRNAKVEGVDIKEEDEEDVSPPKRVRHGAVKKEEASSEADDEVRKLFERGNLSSLTVAELRAAISSHCACVPKSTLRKAQLVEMLEQFFNAN
ncbi:unnamed protein product [Caenorhabditis auriculariae]|uniref:Ku domain-containing protein n=1 Tax=Caenorhabditis auriculariae TaxID=2777116 RepID=A0A8S1HZS5_9PELO|nr:unnamed protein product [Caenorhabditis auriculariae]